MTGVWILAAATLVGVLAGGSLGRGGWSTELFRGLVVAALLPWAAQHVGVAYLRRSAFLNPAAAGPSPAVGPPDLVAPLLVALLLAVVLWRPEPLRWVGAALPVLGAALTWWVTLPLAAEASLRGWVFLPPALTSDWLLGWHLGATCLLGAYVGSSRAVAGRAG